MKYKFRLVFYHVMPGFFHTDEECIKYPLNDKLQIEVYPRDANTLIKASKYHIDCGGFLSEQNARDVGEKLRLHLRMLNSILNLGLSIPNSDGNSGYVSEEIKAKIRGDGGELLDTIVGLHVYPDDGMHFEHVTSGKFNVFPSEPLYVLRALKETWPSTFDIDENTEEVLEILNISVRERSPKIRFLTTYLAMEQIIERHMRSDGASKLIDQFISITNESDITDTERTSLVGTLGYLKEQSFSSAFSSFSKRITSPKTINGKPATNFVSDCITLRNKIAHNAAIESTVNLEEYTKHLREMAMGILWSKNSFPNISVYRPADTVSVEKMEIRYI